MNQQVSMRKAIAILLGIFLVLSSVFIGVGSAFIWDKPVYKSQDDYELEVAQKNVEQYPSNARLRVELGWVYLQRKRHDEAIREFENALKIDKDYTGAKLNLAIAKGEKGDLQEAKKILEEIKDKNKQNVDARYLLGQIYKEEKQFEKAVEEFRFVLNANPGTVDYMYQIAHVYELQGNKEKAVAEYQKVLSYVPDYAPAKQALDRLQPTGGSGSK
ncbi:tetratricopeptide repeat protein [Effusibacillus lacus]|uniref:Cytochrome c-type biogenesis protein H TPR domain-containing protein n=1 Tax=Effusibacillus lacus TaxID=1348429 RepID=A0A292YSA5_9BACL|nr:tetratricopeptide repeat protein [Effusibacillus lacus]TCS76125.1 tetratricopeptide repeat protein [Effusibacillus lacus]GAX91365.1 hypothetical protein EFBL_3034 [Effusibacillus lacus]